MLKNESWKVEMLKVEEVEKVDMLKIVKVENVENTMNFVMKSVIISTFQHFNFSAFSTFQLSTFQRVQHFNLERVRIFLALPHHPRKCTVFIKDYLI